MSDLVGMLGEAEVFGCFTVLEREQLASVATQKDLVQGQTLCWQGEPWPFVYYIVSGSLKSTLISPEGRTYVVSTWEQGVEFWGHTLFDWEGMPTTAQAVEDTIGYQWRGEDVLNKVFHNYSAMRALLRRQTQLIRKRREHIYNLAFNPVTSRLAKLLVDQFKNAESLTVQRDLTLDQIASMVASSPEVVCRTLYQLQRDGLLHVTRASITLQDREALEGLIRVE